MPGLDVYERLPDMNAAESELTQAAQLQQEIWSKAVVASAADPTQNVARLLLPALNDMTDVTTARTIALAHSPAAADFWTIDDGCSAERSARGL